MRKAIAFTSAVSLSAVAAVALPVTTIIGNITQI
jgi:hypothetical protein